MTEPQTEANDNQLADAKERRAYLIEMYKLYHGHINTMFNYFLILSGLIANACIISLQQQAAISKLIPAAIGIFGFITSIVSLFVHLRSRKLIDTIEAGLEREEGLLFTQNEGFLNVHIPGAWWLSRHRYQFRVIYVLFALGFLLIAIYAGCMYWNQPHPKP